MSALNVNQISSSNGWAGIDISNVSQISNQIMERAQSKKTIDLNNVDLTKFTRSTQGIDLYSSKTSIDVQRQVSMINAGLLNTPAIDTSYLKAQAATALYGNNVTKNVEGKMTINVPEGESLKEREVTPLPKSTEVFNTANLGKDRRGSNPFGMLTSGAKHEDGKE